MREELKDLSGYRLYGLREGDFEYTIRLTQEFINTRKQIFQQGAAFIEKELPREADDILDDIGYYTGIDCLYLWHFCLWTLQGILEGMIQESFLPSRSTQPLRGIKAKLDAMKEAGYTIEQVDYDELLEWAKLRNVLSHFPLEQYRPGPLREEDIIEYKELLEKVCRKWREQQPQICESNLSG